VADLRELTRTFVDLADTLVDEFDAIELLHVLTGRCVELLGVDAAGVMLADGGGKLWLSTAAAADAIRALITAGIVEEAAAAEAVEALTAAGIIVAAANETATEAVAEAAATIKAASITMAQARVLRYLPTQLSFAVIADKLGISRAAAKERAERAYKKLGVHSRTEAVARARALGIID